MCKWREREKGKERGRGEGEGEGEGEMGKEHNTKMSAHREQTQLSILSSNINYRGMYSSNLRKTSYDQFKT